MAPATWIVTLGLHLLLVAGGLALLRPPGQWNLRLARLVRADAPYALAWFGALAAVLLESRYDAALAALVGRDLTPVLQGVEGRLVLDVAAATPEAGAAALGFVLAVVHPWMVYFLPLLHGVAGDRRAVRSTLLAFPVAYLLSVPFRLLAPVAPPFDAFAVANPLPASLPAEITGIAVAWRTPANAFPAFAVALALLLGYATWGSRNPRARAAAGAYASLMLLAPLALAQSWLTSVAAGVVLAGLGATLVGRVVDVERIALRRVTPSPPKAQAITEAADELVERTRETGEDHGVVDVRLVGSVAKDTYLQQNVDLDVFALFPPDLDREALEERGLELGRTVLPDGHAEYAEHPYIHGSHRGLEADVVPAYAVDSPREIQSAVDRTPFHTDFVNGELAREQRDDVRLLKQFMHGVDVYGAEARVQGFSGYLCELLVLKYGSFRGVLEAAHRWRPGVYLTLTPQEDPPEFDAPLVFLDPVDPDRNAASAVAGTTLETFIEAARNYVRRPQMTFFFPRPLTPRPTDDLAGALPDRDGDVLVVGIPRPDAVEDHLWDQARKARDGLADLLERHGFRVRGADATIEPRPLVLLDLASATRDETDVHVGPPTHAEEHARRFREKWEDHEAAVSDVYERDGRLVVEREPKHATVEGLVRERLDEVGLGKDLDAAASEAGVDVYVGAGAAREEARELLTRYLDPRRAWQR